MRYLSTLALAAMLTPAVAPLISCGGANVAKKDTAVKPVTVGVLPTGEPEPSFFGFGSYTFPAMINNNDVTERGCVYRSGADISRTLDDVAVASRASLLEYERMSIREAYRAKVPGRLISSRRTPPPMNCYVMDSISWGEPASAPPAPSSAPTPPPAK